MNEFSVNDPQYWDASASNYRATGHPFTQQYAEAVIARLGVGPGMRVLDIATGTGAAALAAQRAGADVLATDFSAGMVQVVLNYGLPRLDAQQMDGQALQLPDSSFDVACSVFGVMMFPDWRAGLREMARVTRKGGTAAVAVWTHPFGAATNLLFVEISQKLFPDFEWPPAIGGMAVLSNTKGLTEALTEAGFSDVVIEAVTFDFQLPLSALHDEAGPFALSPLWKKLDAEQRSRVLDEIRSIAAQRGVGDMLPIPSTALIGIGRRA